jgi:hypothetical protein
MENDRTDQLLQQAIRLLRIMARPQIAEIRERFEADVLISAKRRQIWEAMDGTKSLATIAKEVGASAEAVRLLVREIEERFPDLIEFERSGSGPQLPRRSLL